MGAQASSAASKCGNASTFVSQKLQQSNTVVVFSKSYWPHAQNTNRTLRGVGVKSLDVIELDQMGEPRNGPVQQELKKLTGVITVPQVFINGKFFGGNDKIKTFGGASELCKALEAAGAQVN